MKSPLTHELMALRVARELAPGDFVNLGMGLPTQVSDYIHPDMGIMLQAENGVLGYGPLFREPPFDIDYINAGGGYISLLPGCSFFSSADSFAMIRGGHLDVTVLGAFQVSEKGDLANWMVPERGVGSVGGAMDLVTGAKRTIVIMEHVTKRGEPRIVKECTYPLTAPGVVKLIVTDLAVIEVTAEGLLLREVAPGYNPEEIQALTEPRLKISLTLEEIQL